jgi:hypothetical protein
MIMNKKMLHSIIAVTSAGIFLLGINQYMHSQEVPQKSYADILKTYKDKTLSTLQETYKKQIMPTVTKARSALQETYQKELVPTITKASSALQPYKSKITPLVSTVKSKVSPKNVAYIGSSSACALVGTQIPCSSALASPYFLTIMAAQVVGGTGASLYETYASNLTPKEKLAKTTADLIIGLKAAAWLELGRRSLLNSPKGFKTYALFFIATQPLMTTIYDSTFKMLKPVRASLEKYLATIPQEKIKQLEETATYLPWTE